MQFVYPSFLWALSLIAIPILIHLFHFRRYKKVLFSDLRFLKQSEEQNKSQQKLRDLLVLICRILAISLLVLAFARPFIPHRSGTALKGQKAVSIYVDNSFSMLNEGPEGELLEAARNKARAIIGSYEDASFQVLSNDPEGWQQRWMDRSEALQRIDEMQASASFKSLESIHQRQKLAFDQLQETAKIGFLISDFQTNTADLASLRPDSNISLHLIPTQAEDQHNLYIDSAWLLSPIVKANEPVKLRIRIANSSGEDAESIPVSLTVNGTQKGLQNIDCRANGSTEAELSFIPSNDSWLLCELAITDHPITFDDHLFFVLKPVSINPVLCINGHSENPFLTALFSEDASYPLKQVPQTLPDFNAFQHYGLIILNEPKDISSGLKVELEKYVSRGGQLLIIPSEDPQAAMHLNELLASLKSPALSAPVAQALQVSKLDLTDNLFANVYQKIPRNPDLPAVMRYYKLLKNTASAGRTLMRLNNDDPFIWANHYGQGRVITLAAPLNTEWSNLPKHAAFVPLMLKMAWGIRRQETIFYTIGRDAWVVFSGGSDAPEKLVQLWNDRTELSGEVSSRQSRSEIYVDKEVREAGILKIGNKQTGRVAGYAAFNYPRSESSQRFASEEELTTWSSQHKGTEISDASAQVLQQQIKAETDGTQLWRVFVWLGLFMLICEMLLLRLMRS